MYISRKKHIYTNITETVPVADITQTAYGSDGDKEVSMGESYSEEQGYGSDMLDAGMKYVSDTERGTEDESGIPNTDTDDGIPGDETVVPNDPQVLDNGMMNSVLTSLSDFMAENTDEGILKIRASSGEGSIPLVNVNILVYKDFSDGRHVFFSGATNTDGVVGDIVLPAPPKINSEQGNGKSPYASYTVSASRDGLVGEEVENVPVFSGIKSIQPIVMKSVGEV